MTDELKCLAHPCDGVMEANLYDASLTCSKCQFQVADESEYSALVAGRQAAIDDETQNPWKAAIIDELIVDCIYSKEHESDPRRALAEAIAWNVKVALDPSASKEARDMQQAAVDAALIDLTHDLGSLYIHRNGHELYNSAIDDVARFIKGQLGTNPLAEAQARIAELEAENADLTKKLEAGWVRVCQTSLGEAYDRISELERELAEQADTIVDGLAKRRELERELAEARKDAERYRWIQRNAEGFSFETPQWDWTGGASDQLNEAIDDAMLAERENE